MKNKSNLIKPSIYLLIGLFVCININAQGKDPLIVKTIPYNLKVFNNPLDLKIKGDSIIEITSTGKTNLFNSPNGNYSVKNAPMVLFKPDSNFIISAKITAKLKEVYDVASLVVYQDDNLWAKLCFENSVNKETTVVSVVTRNLSDDCNSVKISEDYVYFLIAKKGDEFSFHYSTDKIKWELIRHFSLKCDTKKLMIGFAAHCSKGEKFTAEFSDIYYSKDTLKKMRTYY
ncbi:DUF1349 domain-containing protein [Saccharicrinis sp. FJH2]|uniref:DUF1349 domain-containing protein n=1 Tax=Saccharicrinis sp. FJH65 TaxID=3344659 RepID=UPI0035F305AD